MIFGMKKKGGALKRTEMRLGFLLSASKNIWQFETGKGRTDEMPLGMGSFPNCSSIPNKLKNVLTSKVSRNGFKVRR